VQVFEPAEIAARFLTADDDVIRAADMPERMLLTTSSLSPHATLGSIPSERFPDDEISSAAEWVATRLSSRVRDEYFFPSGKHYDLLPALIMAVSTVLQYILQEYLEVPYIWVHRRDHISVFEPGKDRVTLLDRDDLWRVHTLASKYRALYLRRKILDTTYEKMHIDDRYYEIDVRPSINSVEGVSDAMEWLALKHKKAYQDAMELDDTGETQRQKQPHRVSQYDVAKASVVSELAHVRPQIFIKFGADILPPCL
jgi:transcription elongation factor SPT6